MTAGTICVKVAEREVEGEKYVGFRDIFRRGRKSSSRIDPEGIFQVTLFVDEDFPADHLKLSSTEVMRVYLEPLGLDVGSLQENGCHLSAGVVKKLPATLPADLLEQFLP